MSRKNLFTLFLVFIIGFFIILAPRKIVWGGFSWQTVPTAGPTRTSTVTPQNTAPVISTATSTRTPGVINTSLTSSTQVIATMTVVSTLMPSEATSSATMTQQFTSIPSIQTEITKTLNSPASPSHIVSLTSTPTNDSTQPVPEGPPFWLLPLTCSIGLVALVFALRLLIRKGGNKT